jgi:hypothetical protein
MKRWFLVLMALALVALPAAEVLARGGRGGGALRGAGRTRARRGKNKKDQAKMEARRALELRDALRIEAADDRV